MQSRSRARRCGEHTRSSRTLLVVAAHAMALDIGVHLAITSEWDNVKWRPMTPAPSLRDADGYFYPMICPNKNYPGYEDVAIDRQGVTDLWTDPRIRQKIEALGIDLIGYDDL